MILSELVACTSADSSKQVLSNYSRVRLSPRIVSHAVLTMKMGKRVDEVKKEVKRR